MKKKIILGVTLFLMLLTLFALSINAAETIETWDISATESDNVTATLYDDGSLVISGTGNMKDWTSSSSAPWYSSYRDKIKSITIEEGVTTIGDDAFRGCSSLTSVVIPDSVTTIGYRAFSSCDALTSVVIGDSVTTIGARAFFDCDSLVGVEIPNSVTAINERAFYDCDALINIELPGSVTTVGSSAFASCDSLTSIKIPDSVTAISNYAFDYCPSLTIYREAPSTPNGWSSEWNSYDCPVVVGFYIDGWDVSLENDGSVMAYLEEIWDDEGYYTLIITGTGDMKGWSFFSSLPWWNCYRHNIKSAVIEEGITNIGTYAFGVCGSMTSIKIPDSVTSIGDNAFHSCDSLTSIVIPDSVITIGDSAFIGCSSLTIYAEAPSQPSGWSSSWNYSNRPVVWGYFDKEASLGEIFTFLGYSFNEEGSMAVGFEINYEALRLYEEKTGETLEIGVVFAGYSLLNGNQPLDNEGNAIELTDGAVVKFDLTEYDYTYYDFIVTEIIDSIKDIPLVISAYINNGEENKYIQENGISDTVSGISYNEAKK